MPEMRERFRRHRVHPDLPWILGEVYAVAVHLRRGDIMSNDRAVVSEDQLVFAMETMKTAVLNAGENHGQAIIFHVFTQGENDLHKLSARNDTTLHIAADDTRTPAKGGGIYVPPHASEELRLAFHSMVMADALLAGSSGLSYAASWLSKGWIWAFQPGKGFSPVNQLPPNATKFRWNDQGVVEIVNIQPPRWPRQAPGSPPGATKASASRNNLN